MLGTFLPWTALVVRLLNIGVTKPYVKAQCGGCHRVVKEKLLVLVSTNG
jgi:hypothetical protein